MYNTEFKAVPIALSNQLRKLEIEIESLIFITPEFSFLRRAN